MEVDQEVSSSGYSSSSSYSLLGSHKWRCGGAVDFEMLNTTAGFTALEPNTSAFTTAGEARYLALKQRRKTNEVEEDRAARQHALKNKRKRVRQAIIDRNRPGYARENGDCEAEADSDAAEFVDHVEVEVAEDSDMTVDGGTTSDFDLYELESELSDSELSFFGAETDTEREEDGYATADFLDSEPESDPDLEELDALKLRQAGSAGDEIVRVRFPFMSMRVFLSDVVCLMEDSFVNDTVVDFCLNHLVFNELPEDVYHIHTFPSTFFYYMQMQLFRDASKKSEPHAERLLRRFSRLAPFVENVDLFENDFLVFPMNDLNHWSLCVVCCPSMLLPKADRLPVESNVIEPRPCIIMLDSQISEQPNLEKYGGHIREFLEFAYIYTYGYSEDLAQRFSADNLPLVIPQRLPQQTNKFDCGLYLLEYSRNLFMHPPSMKKVSAGQFDFLAEYPQFSTTNKRAALRRQILGLNDQFEALMNQD